MWYNVYISNEKGAGTMTVEYIKDLRGIDLNKMSDDQLQRLVQTTAMHVNGRMKALYKANLAHRSLAYQQINTNGGELSSKGKSRGELLREFKRGQQYLKSKTGTVSGTRDYMKNIYEAATGENVDITKRAVQKELNSKFTDLEVKTGGLSIWEIVDKARESKWVMKYVGSDVLIRKTYQLLINKSEPMTWEDFVNEAATKIITEAQKGGVEDGIPYTTEESLIRRI